MSAALFGISPFFGFLRENISACVIQMFFIFYGLLVSYSILFLLALHRFVVLRTNNIGIWKKRMEDNRYTIVAGTITVTFLYQVMDSLLVPKVKTIVSCSAPNLYGRHIQVFTGLNIVLITILLISTFLFYLRSSCMIWNLFFVRSVAPLEEGNERQECSMANMSNLTLFSISTKNRNTNGNVGNMCSASKWCGSTGNGELTVVDFNPWQEKQYISRAFKKESFHKHDMNNAACQDNKSEMSVVDFDTSTEVVSGHPVTNMGIELQDVRVDCGAMHGDQRQCEDSQRSYNSWEIRAFFTCVIIAFQTIVLTGPLIGGFWVDIVTGKPVSLQIKFILSCLYMINSLTNFFIYGWRIPEIREELKRICFKFRL